MGRLQVRPDHVHRTRQEDTESHTSVRHLRRTGRTQLDSESNYRKLDERRCVYVRAVETWFVIFIYVDSSVCWCIFYVGIDLCLNYR
jgi:hypothetical protein